MRFCNHVAIGFAVSVLVACAGNYYGTSEIAFKPSFSGSKMVSNVGTPAAVSSVNSMQMQCFGSSTTNCVYYK